LSVNGQGRRNAGGVMQENKELLIAAEVIALVVSLCCVAMLFFRPFAASVACLGIIGPLFGIYFATVRHGFKD
jgi:hypothetical protein